MSIAHIFQFTIQEFHFQLSVSLIRCVCQTATFNYLMLTNVLFFRTLPLRMLRVPPLWSWMIQWLEIYLCTLWQCLGMDCLLFSTLKDYLHKLTSFQGIIPPRTFLCLSYETAFFYNKARAREREANARERWRSGEKWWRHFLIRNFVCFFFIHSASSRLRLWNPSLLFICCCGRRSQRE